MCGIVGARDDWLRSRGLTPRVSIADAVEELRWRGRDGSGVCRAGEWWLGCARLAISAGPEQPLQDADAKTTVCMNGAVTNARALWQELDPDSAGATPLPNDAALPGLAVRGRRLDLLASMRGHHAYAVHDADDGALYLGQDRFGERPLHCVFARRGGVWRLVAFASTRAALRRIGVAAREPERAVAQWFRFGWSEAAPTEPEPGLRVCDLPSRGRPYVTRGSTDPTLKPAVATGHVEASAGDRDLRGALADSVRRCLDTPSSAGLCLSGGVDSSCIALTLGELGAKVPAYQFCARGAPTDERAAATAAAAAAGLALQPVDGGPELLDALPRLTRLHGGPLGDPSVLAAHAVAAAANRDGVKVLLGGEGADELLLGYRRYRALAAMPRLPWLRSTTRWLLPWSMRPAVRSVRAAASADPVRALLAVTPPAFGAQVLAPALGAAPCWRDEPRRHATKGALALDGRAHDVEHYLARDLLPKLDVALLAAGVEGRCPYLEADVGEFGKDIDALGKRPLREAFAAQLPEAVARLPKRGFSLPLDSWFREELDALDVLAEPRARQRPHLRPRGLELAVDRHRRGRADLGHALYLLYAFELHLRDWERAPPQP